MTRVNVTVKEKEKKMNPLVFGHFVEFMRDCIDGGMWSQLLKNRGFDKRKDIPEGVVDGNPNIAEHWVRTGYKNSFCIELDSTQSMAADGYAQHIQCYNDYDGYVGIAQENLVFHMQKYEGYIWAKATGHARVRLAVKDGEEKELFAQDIFVEDDWKKYTFEFQIFSPTKNGIFEIRLLGEGDIWLDGTSIMPSDHQNGIWREVFEHVKALKPPVIRYPGGCFADCYHFKDGIGQIDTRPYRHNKHWGGYTDNSFGTDEFIRFCRDVGCEPMICINFGSGTAQEAADWVEYCNGSAETPYGRLRALNGHEQPYNVKYWDIGNETFGDWEIGHCTAEEYSKKYLEFYRKMKEKDDSIMFLVCGGDGDSRSQEWNRMLKSVVADSMDVLCLHMYSMKSMEGKKHSNEDIYYAVAGSVKKYEEILNESYRVLNEDAKKEILLAVTEYNQGTIIDSYREQTLEAAIFNAGMLNMFLRNADKLLLCNYSDLVNGWPGGCIVSKNGRAFGTGSYYVLKLYGESGIQRIVDVETDAPVYSTKEWIGNIEPISDVPLADVAAGINEEGEPVYFVVNRSLDQELCICLEKEACMAEITTICSEKTSDMNFADDLKLFPVTRTEILPEAEVTVKPHSINRIRVIKKNR